MKKEVIPMMEKNEEINEEVVNKKEKKKVEKLQEEVERLKAESDHWKNEYYRAYADTKNLRNNLEKDYKEAMRYRSEGFIDELLPILDSFHMALANEPTDPALKNYLTGFQYVYRNLVSVLESEGVSEITPNVGDKFNANTMNAVDTVEDEKENVITKVYGNGYKLHDRIIRPAMVQVSVRKVENKEEASNEKVDA